MARAVCGSTASVCLAAFAIVLALPAERALISNLSSAQFKGAGFLTVVGSHLAVLGPREWTAVVLELDDTGRGFSRHVVDRVLIAEPVRAFRGVEKMIAPVIGMHTGSRDQHDCVAGCRRSTHFPNAALIPPWIGLA